MAMSQGRKNGRGDGRSEDAAGRRRFIALGRAAHEPNERGTCWKS